MTTEFWAQCFAKIEAEHTDWQDRFSKGDVKFVEDWLSKQIWSKGCELESQELMLSATRSITKAESHMEHLETSYSAW